MWYRLPPAGNPICWPSRPGSAADCERLFLPWRSAYHGSGTAALAAALVAASRLAPGRGYVALPAYGCPDLIAAVLCAGLQPRLVDLAPDSTRMDLRSLTRALGDDVCAVVGVDLFGLPEAYAGIRPMAEELGVALIQDAAQALPQADSDWQGDWVVLSFGRGKPVNLLGGGAVLTLDPQRAAALPRPLAARNLPGWWPRLRGAAYNALLSPRLYWLPAKLPLGLGETRFRPLARIDAAPNFVGELLPANLALRRADLARGCRAELARALRPFADRGFIDIAERDDPGHRVALVRYPLLLADRAGRDRCWRALEAAGLGASRMYLTPLAGMPGVPVGLGRVQNFPNASAFAGRLLTLPLHLGVDSRIVSRLVDTIVAALPAAERSSAAR